MKPDVCLWMDPPARLSLPPSSLHLWRFSITAELIRSDRFRPLLSGDELQRASRLLDRSKGAFFIAARACLRMILGRYLNAPPQEIAFTCNSYGKPFLLPPHSNLYFNLSHSGTEVVLAVSHEKNTGVDLEKIDFSLNFDSIADQFFTTSELLTLKRHQGRRKRRVFYRLWTRKEAILKAAGTGFRGGSCEVEEFLPHWTLKTFPLLDDYLCSCAVDAPLSAICRFSISDREFFLADLT